MIELINRKQIKALFLDEWHIDKESLENIPKCVGVIWIAPDATSLYEHSELQLHAEYEILRLELNLRNNKDIVNATISHAEKEHYRYAHGISRTPINFPRGKPPVYFKQNKENPTEPLKEALIEGRKHTSNGGILVIIDKFNDDLRQFVRDSTRDKNLKSLLKHTPVKYYTVEETDFSANENPSKFLNDGGILITDLPSTLGFEFATVIYFKQVNYKLHVVVLEHECNAYMRCKAQLIIINEEGKASDYENLYPVAFERWMEKGKLLFRKDKGVWLKKDWNPIKLVDKYVNVPDDYTFDFKALHEFHQNDKEKLSAENEQNMIRCIFDLARLLKLLMPILVKDDQNEKVQELRAFYGDGGIYQLLKEYVENNSEDTYEQLRKRAVEGLDSFHPLLDIVTMNMSWRLKRYFLNARIQRALQKFTAFFRMNICSIRNPRQTIVRIGVYDRFDNIGKK